MLSARCLRILQTLIDKVNRGNPIIKLGQRVDFRTVLQGQFMLFLGVNILGKDISFDLPVYRFFQQVDTGLQPAFPIAVYQAAVNQLEVPYSLLIGVQQIASIKNFTYFFYIFRADFLGQKFLCHDRIGFWQESNAFG